MWCKSLVKHSPLHHGFLMCNLNSQEGFKRKWKQRRISVDFGEWIKISVCTCDWDSIEDKIRVVQVQGISLLSVKNLLSFHSFLSFTSSHSWSTQKKFLVGQFWLPFHVCYMLSVLWTSTFYLTDETSVASASRYLLWRSFFNVPSLT